MIRVVILAGGFGTRIKHLLRDIPKPMAPVAGRPFIEWVVRFFARHGCSDFVLSTGHLSEVIEAHFARQPVPGVRVECCRETTPLGTAGGFLNCVRKDADAQTRWLVTNGDSLVVADPTPLITALSGSDTKAALMGLELADASRFGSLDLAADGRRLAGFREKRPGQGVINAGVYAFNHATVLAMPEKRPLSFEYNVFPGLAQEGCVAVHSVSAPFIDIGTPETLVDAERFILSQSHHFAPSSS
ncbi:nucleotidyltransferase [Nibricoccus aquaticus]|uniref:Nucleotidyltransferase n=1 Tax=Nibricoccus aquaticus TaxID=2576891 RepID=A0A290Q6Q2_9BACT|nr:sugar phosphate nucleotidyltransferase [Nibricoccus aquaticus]ATC64103.1 nucleotidyltransferase [Nibricoccus aquaticus]